MSGTQNSYLTLLENTIMSNTVGQLKQHLQTLQNNKAFELFVISIIVISALLTGAKTYDIGSTASIFIEWSDTFITLFFLV